MIWGLLKLIWFLSSLTYALKYVHNSLNFMYGIGSSLFFSYCIGAITLNIFRKEKYVVVQKYIIFFGVFCALYFLLLITLNVPCELFIFQHLYCLKRWKVWHWSLLIRCILPELFRNIEAFFFRGVWKVSLINCDELFIHWFWNDRVVSAVYICGRLLVVLCIEIIWL